MAPKKKTDETSRTPDLSMTLVRVTLKGTAPLLMHSRRLADPMDPIVKQMKVITGGAKGGKGTDDTHDALSRLEYEGGFWLDEKGLPTIPGDAIDRLVKDGGKLLGRKGEALARTVRCIDECNAFTYEGHEKIKKTADLLKHYENFAYRKQAVNPASGSTVMRTRPKFRNWSTTFTLRVLLGHDIDLAHVKSALEMQGLMVGLGDWHKKFGLFEVAEFKEIKK